MKNKCILHEKFEIDRRIYMRKIFTDNLPKIQEKRNNGWEYLRYRLNC